MSAWCGPRPPGSSTEEALTTDPRNHLDGWLWRAVREGARAPSRWHPAGFHLCAAVTEMRLEFWLPGIEGGEEEGGGRGYDRSTGRTLRRGQAGPRSQWGPPEPTRVTKLPGATRVHTHTHTHTHTHSDTQPGTKPRAALARHPRHRLGSDRTGCATG